MPDPTATLEHRLRLAHTARRAKEHQLDDIRRALCDAGLMQDDDPYGHADLADVIRQVGAAEAESASAPTGPVLDRTAVRNVILFVASATGHPRPEFVDMLTDRLWAKTGHGEPEKPERCVVCDSTEVAYHNFREQPFCWPCANGQDPQPEPASPVPCSINHNCPSQSRPEPLTARGEARCQSQHRAGGEPLVQCALAVHPDDTHTDYDAGQTPPAGRNPELPWFTWRDKPEPGPTGAPVADGRAVVILYVNHRGQRGYRQVLPQRLWFGTTEWHRELQWFLDATDLDRGVLRSFALRDILAFDLQRGPLA